MPHEFKNALELLALSHWNHSQVTTASGFQTPSVQRGSGNGAATGRELDADNTVAVP